MPQTENGGEVQRPSRSRQLGGIFPQIHRRISSDKLCRKESLPHEIHGLTQKNASPRSPAGLDLADRGVEQISCLKNDVDVTHAHQQFQLIFG
jgi:hypothetical protein